MSPSRRRDLLATLGLAATAGLPASAGCLRRRRSDAAHQTIRYAATDGVDASAQSLDVYPAPDGTAPGPVVVWVHGGGWVVGDKRAVDAKPGWVADEHGGTFVSVNYRLSATDGSGPRHPVHVEDVARAVAWTVDTAPEYGGDPDRIVLLGHSAGAHLVALVASAQEYLAAAGASVADLAGVFPVDCALYDLLWARGQDGVRRRLVDAAIGTDEAMLRDASPQHRLDADDHLPPLVCAYTNDVRRRATERFVGAVRETGAAATVVDRTDLQGAAGGAHMAVNRRIGTAGDPLTRELDAVIESA